MAAYAPGVIIQEVPSPVRPIVGVGTSTAGFIGICTGATVMPENPAKPGTYLPLVPEGQPYALNSWQDFRVNFGNIGDANRYLAQAVYGFFENGGTRCWVIRYSDITKIEAQLTDGLALFEGIDEISIVAAPLDKSYGIDPKTTKFDAILWATVPNLLIEHCRTMMNRFAILDCPVDTPSAIGTLTIPPDDKGYAALYYPRILVAESDPTTHKSVDPVLVPASGHIAGIYARSDAQRGVHKAPANEIVMGALGLEYSLSAPAQQPLNERGVNVIRFINGGLRVWGARTVAVAVDPSTEWKYINVRRTFMYLRKSIEDGVGWIVFEPNTAELWAKIRRNVTAFLMTAWHDGMLFGTTPQQAFYVRCDESTNPRDLRNQGQVITEIGLAIVRPAEFVIFRMSQWESDK